MDRRDFVATTMLAMLGAVVAGCSDGQFSGPLGPGTASLPTALTISLADFPALATVGGTVRVDANTSRPIAVTRSGPTSFVAMSMVCPHAGYKPIQIVTTGFRCPNHGAEFTAEGDWTGGQRTRALSRYEVTYNPEAGTLTIS